MRKKSKHSNSDDAALFRDMIGDVQPISGGRRLPEKPRPKPHAKFSQQDDADVLDELLTGGPDPLDVEMGDELEFHRPHVTRKVRRQLRRGNYSIQAEIDLHGMTLFEARDALRAFIVECCDLRLGCVRVVHGKGLGSGHKGPVLKAGVNRWLRRWNEVVAFCSARPPDGGTGAVYVLLNK
jgi:DNA-nicking Smr family endonuclease